MGISFTGNQCTLFINLDEKGYADVSASASYQAEYDASATNAYPVIYPEPFNTLGCGYGQLGNFVKKQCSALASELNLDMDTCHQSELIITLYCGTRKDYDRYIKLLGDRLLLVKDWVRSASDFWPQA